MTFKRTTNAQRAWPKAAPAPRPRLDRRPVEQRSFKGSDPRGRPPVLAAVVAEPLDQHWRSAESYDRRAVVVNTEALTTTGTLAITLRVSDGREFTFSPGQFIGIEAEMAGARRRRTPYCILSAPSEGGTFRLLVRVVPQGPLSGYLAGLRPGQEVAFRGPTGRSMLPREDGTELVLMATGVGVSPLYSLAQHLLAIGTERRVRLLWGLRLAQDICLRQELDQLVEHHRNFSYHISLSRPDAGWTDMRGRLGQSAPALIGPLEGKHFYLCGNGAMVAELSAALSELGVSETLIYQEAFFDGRHRPSAASVAAVRDRFAAVASPLVIGEDVLFPLERPLAAHHG